MNNNATMTRDINRPDKTYAGLMYHGEAQDYALYRHVRTLFLQQSALYLGGDPNDSNVLSICFSDNEIHR